MEEPPKSHGRKSIKASLKPRDLMSPNPRLARSWRAQIITLFPDSFPGVLGHSLTGRALQEGKWSLETIDLREFGVGKHKNVDDTPAGGGAGMILRSDVVANALDYAITRDADLGPFIYLSPRGRVFTQAMAKSWSQRPGVRLLSGRFEGVDQRVLDQYKVEEISLGDFVLSGGEIAAQAMIDAAVRLIPGVLGNKASVDDESHTNGYLEHPHYTRPSEWRGHKIPDVLQSGNHQKIAQWREKQSLDLTQKRRPDLLRKHHDAD